MLHSYLKGAKLCAWLSHPDCPPTIQECKILLDQIYHTHMHDHALPLNLHDLDSFDNVRVPETWNATYTTGGVFYSQCSTHLRNSQIFFYPNGNQASPAVPGCLLHFAVWRQCALVKNTADPFAAYPHFLVKMYSSTLKAKLECVKMSWAISHHA
ncbi:hypothetical protein V8B97DRAFT_2022634 [Scleroderma yunnanense]